MFFFENMADKLNNNTLSEEISNYNETLAAELGEADDTADITDNDDTLTDDTVSPETDGDGKTESDDKTDDEADGEEEDNADDAEETDDADDTESDGDGDADDDGAQFEFTENSDWETFEKERVAYLETVEIPAELQTILDRQTAEIAAARSSISTLETFGSIESVEKTMRAFAQIFETDTDADGNVIKNVRPVVDLLRTEYTNEFSPLAQEIFEADSMKYQGLSVFQERLVDTFKLSGEKLNRLQEFLAGTGDLPLPVTNLPVPEGIDKSLSEGWYAIPEFKRFEIQERLSAVQTLEAELNDEDTSLWRKEEIAQELAQKRGQLSFDLETVKTKQTQIVNERDAESVRQRQVAEQRVQFQNAVVETYNKEIFSLAETFTQELAPKLTFFEGTQQLSAARDIEARVLNALEADNTGNATPNAAYFEKQLKDEGVKFDFQKGRQLLANLYNTHEKIMRLEALRESPKAIELAKAQKQRILADIKAEKHQLLGQISAKYVGSNGKALKTKVDALNQKKQVVRPRILGTNAPERKNITPEDNRRAIREWNRQLDKRIKNGDDLYESLS